MNNYFKPALAAAALGLASLAHTGLAHGANVGYTGNCYGENLALPITAAGHTPVAVPNVTAQSLSGLASLVISPCGTNAIGGNAALTSAIDAGLTVIVHDNNYFGQRTGLPGMAGVVVTQTGTRDDIDFPLDSPVLHGPGGTLTNASLDHGSSSNHGVIARALLPAGSVVLATTANTNDVVTYSSSYGSGHVVYSTIPLGCYLIGGNCATAPFLYGVSAGMQQYAANIIAWATGPGFTSCAAEGFKGSKLTLCHQVCEMNYSGAKLKALITAWTRLYREDPPCAR